MNYFKDYIRQYKKKQEMLEKLKKSKAEMEKIKAELEELKCDKNSEHHRGHEIIKTTEYRYKDTRELVRENKYRDCGHCGRPNTPEGHDGCLGELPGVINACCGHGKDKGYIQFENGVIVRGWFTVENIK